MGVVVSFRSRDDLNRDALIAQARANYESIFPTASQPLMDGGKARIRARRSELGLAAPRCDLAMDHADPADYTPSEWTAPDHDIA